MSGYAVDAGGGETESGRGSMKRGVWRDNASSVSSANDAFVSVFNLISRLSTRLGSFRFGSVQFGNLHIEDSENSKRSRRRRRGRCAGVHINQNVDLMHSHTHAQQYELCDLPSAILSRSSTPASTSFSSGVAAA